MGETLVIAALCGLKDSINPCFLVTLTGFLILVSKLKERRAPFVWCAAFFISVVFIALLTFSLGALMEFLYSEIFFQTVRKVYLVIGVVLFFLGGLHWYDWVLLRKKKEARFFPLINFSDDISLEQRLRLNTKIIGIIISLGIVLSALSTIWPVEGYISIFSGFLMVPGKSVETYLMLLVYNFFSILPLLIVWAFVSSEFFSKLLAGNPTMIKIIVSAWLFSLGSGLIYIFR